MSAHSDRGLTPNEVARRLRVSPDKVRTSDVRCGRPRWVISSDALAEFERRRVADPPPKPQRRRRRTALVDYYPD